MLAEFYVDAPSVGKIPVEELPGTAFGFGLQPLHSGCVRTPDDAVRQVGEAGGIGTDEAPLFGEPVARITVAHDLVEDGDVKGVVVGIETQVLARQKVYHNYYLIL